MAASTRIRIDPDIADPRVHDWNLTLEKEVMANTVVRIGYVGNHTVNIQQSQAFNDSTPGPISGTSTQQDADADRRIRQCRDAGRIDQTVYGSITQYNSTGYEWYNGSQFELEQRFSKGIGFQVFYNLANALRATGTVPDPTNYLPGATSDPTYDAREQVPQLSARHHGSASIRSGGTSSPTCRSVRASCWPAMRRASLNKIIGGWQIAGTGSWRTSYWTLPDDASRLSDRDSD